MTFVVVIDVLGHRYARDVAHRDLSVARLAAFDSVLAELPARKRECAYVAAIRMQASHA